MGCALRKFLRAFKVCRIPLCEMDTTSTQKGAELAWLLFYDGPCRTCTRKTFSRCPTSTNRLQHRTSMLKAYRLWCPVFRRGWHMSASLVYPTQSVEYGEHPGRN